MNLKMLSRKNSCYFIGELVEVKSLKQDVYLDKNGKEIEYVAADIIVKSSITPRGSKEPIEVTNELRNFTKKYKKDGTLNANYNSICNIRDMLNKRVTVSGASLEGTRFWSSKNQQLVPSVKYNFNIIHLASANQTEDKAEFDFSGFVFKPLFEKCDEEGNTLYYQMTVAQANYREDNFFTVDFIVDKDNLAAKQSIESYYEQGATVEILGICRNVVTTVTKEEPTAFGDPILKTSLRSDKKLVILSGKDVIVGEGEYSTETIIKLNEAYIAQGASIKAAAIAKEDGSTMTNGDEHKTPSRKSALAGLI